MITTYKCCHCSLGFFESASLLNHAEVHLSKCELCNVIFYDEKALEVHNSRVHEVEEVDLVQCSVCNKDFYSIASMEDYIEEWHKCDHCKETIVENIIAHEIVCKHSNKRVPSANARSIKMSNVSWKVPSKEALENVNKSPIKVNKSLVQLSACYY